MVHMSPAKQKQTTIQHLAQQKYIYNCPQLLSVATDAANNTLNTSTPEINKCHNTIITTPLWEDIVAPYYTIMQKTVMYGLSTNCRVRQGREQARLREGVVWYYWYSW